MFIIGLTGGIASGKSLVARVFQDLGAHVIDADRIAHELLEPDEQAWCEVVNYFGKEILHPDKRIDRGKLGKIVFNDAEKRAWLNKCLHPRVFEAYTAQVRNIECRQPDAIIVLEAALLIETGYHRMMDKLVVVTAKREQQIERLISRNNLSSAQARIRIQSQLPLGKKKGYADYIVDNSGAREETKRKARELFRKLKQDAEMRET
jgi:dephospho-CoA kinase